MVEGPAMEVTPCFSTDSMTDDPGQKRSTSSTPLPTAIAAQR